LLFPIAVIGIGLTMASPHFMSIQNFVNVGNQIAINVIIALGMTILITGGGIDLSVGSNVALTGIVVAQYFHMAGPGNSSILVAILIGLAVGGAIGLVNGMIISLLDVPPFICTLGTMTAIRGFAFVASDGRPIMGMPKEFLNVFYGFVAGIPKPVITAAAVAILAAFIFNRTTFGRKVKAIGGNERCVRICGIDVVGMKILLYGLVGALSAMAGLVLTTTMATADPLAGNWYELDAIAVVVMGGTLLNGGKGTIVGTLLGAVLLGLVRNGLNLLSIQATYHTLVVGLLILFSVILSSESFGLARRRLWSRLRADSRNSQEI
jgi:ribose/xylose/arabinose/galactoside ABC-type transport system permease subunit